MGVLMDVTLVEIVLYATTTRHMVLRVISLVKIPLALARLRVTLMVTLVLVVVSAPPGLPAMHATKRAPMVATAVLVDATLLACVKHATKTRRLALRALTIV
jgi:hypothetical protein